jgi:hypothetical protein
VKQFLDQALEILWGLERQCALARQALALPKAGELPAPAVCRLVLDADAWRGALARHVAALEAAGEGG